MPTHQREPRNIRVFISYRNSGISRGLAPVIAEKLSKEHGYTVFIDTEELRKRGGLDWRKTIFENVRNSDVLIVLLEKETADSDWVQREVDVARGANVSLLPIKVDEVDVSDVQEKLAVDDLQYLQFETATSNYDPIVKSIESLATETRRRQDLWYGDLKESRKTKRPEISTLRQSTFRLNEVPHVEVCIASGDMTEMGAIDVLVNTENDYMQMARVFESYTLSSRLRYIGAHIVGKVYMEDDTVQRQLDEIIQKSPEIRRPVPITSVIATHAGHPKSKLHRKLINGKKTGARYIFHVASVNVNPNRDKVIPVGTDDEVIACVHNALEKVFEIDSIQGIISPEGCETYEKEVEAKESYEPIESIIFPLFGAGRGGRSATVVIPAMVDGIKRFLLANQNNPALGLKEIHLCIHSKSDLGAAEQAFLDKRFDRV